MAGRIFWMSVVVCALAAALANLPYASLLGIDQEPARIAFYGGTGLLAGLAGVVAAISGLVWLLSRRSGFSTAQRRVMWVVLGALAVLFIVAVVRRMAV